MLWAYRFTEEFFCDTIICPWVQIFSSSYWPCCSFGFACIQTTCTDCFVIYIFYTSSWLVRASRLTRFAMALLWNECCWCRDESQNTQGKHDDTMLSDLSQGNKRVRISSSGNIHQVKAQGRGPLHSEASLCSIIHDGQKGFQWGHELFCSCPITNGTFA